MKPPNKIYLLIPRLGIQEPDSLENINTEYIHHTAVQNIWFKWCIFTMLTSWYGLHF